MDDIEYWQTVGQWEQQDKPWEKYNMTETEYRTYEDEYADYLDSIQFTGNSIKDKIALQNAREQRLHEQRREAALAKIRELRRAQKEQAELDH